MDRIITALEALDSAPHMRARAALVDEWRRQGLHRGLTLGQAIAAGTTLAPAVKIVFGSRLRPSVTHAGAIHEQATAVAAGLARLGFQAGDRIIIQMPNWQEGLVAFCAAALLGLVIVPVIPIYGPAELGHIARVTQAKGLVIPDRWGKVDFAARLEALPGDLALRHVIVVGDMEMGRSVVRWSDLTGHGTIAAPFAGPSHGACLINFTSGTTSEPKGVVHSHDSLVAEVPAFPILTPAAAGPALWPLPAGHIAGVIAWLRPLLAADPTILIDQWEDELAAELIRAHKPDRVGAAPFHVDFYARNADLLDHGIIHMPIGAASVPPSLVERTQALGIPSTRTYGCTEQPTITGAWPEDPLHRRANTDGRVLRGVSIRLLDEDGREVPAGLPGEIVSTGPELFKGYLDPAHNEGAFTPDGWFRTGDIGVVTEDGYLTIVDRKKDIVIRGGENISSREVEDVLARHPAVLEAAVVAWPHARYSEQVAAFVVTRPGATLTVADLVDFFRRQGVAVQKTPEHLVITESLPRNAVGKIVKGPLRERARSLAVEAARTSAV